MTDVTRQEWVQQWWTVIRDIISFFGGLAVIAYETIEASADRPWLFVVAIGMMGIPFAAKMDRWLGKLPAPPPASTSDDGEHPHS